MNNFAILQADARNIPLADQSVDMVLGSPPYCDARTYGIDAQRNCTDWVDWMLDVTTEALRVCRGAVVWVAAGVTRDRNYWPACEGLMWEWFKRGGSMYRPCYWHRYGISGSGGDQWFRFDVEYVMCFKRAGKLPWTNNTACGHPPKYGPGGEMSHRTTNGSRVNEHAVVYSPPAIANPGTLIKTQTGGGHMGNPLAHENEAPYPEKLAEHFILSLCKPGGVVLDPFGGSGTTAAAAVAHKRRAIVADIRYNQCELMRRRLRETQVELFAGATA